MLHRATRSGNLERFVPRNLGARDWRAGVSGRSGLHIRTRTQSRSEKFVASCWRGVTLCKSGCKLLQSVRKVDWILLRATFRITKDQNRWKLPRLQGGIILRLTRQLNTWWESCIVILGSTLFIFITRFVKLDLCLGTYPRIWCWRCAVRYEKCRWCCDRHQVSCSKRKRTGIWCRRGITRTRKSEDKWDEWIIWTGEGAGRHQGDRQTDRRTDR